VRKAVQACLRQAALVEKARRGLSAPQEEYASALAQRDALLPAWNRAYRRLKRQATAV
jgi:hypothetical protein